MCIFIIYRVHFVPASIRLSTGYNIVRTIRGFLVLASPLQHHTLELAFPSRLHSSRLLPPPFGYLLISSNGLWLFYLCLLWVIHLNNMRPVSAHRARITHRMSKKRKNHDIGATTTDQPAPKQNKKSMEKRKNTVHRLFRSRNACAYFLVGAHTGFKFTTFNK